MITRQEKLGIAFADTIVEVAHQTYNANRGRKIILACIKQLKRRFDEIQEKKAIPEYKKARYG